MNAGQLRTILEHVPDDLPVRLGTCHHLGRPCSHIHNVVRRTGPHAAVELAGCWPIWGPCPGTDDFDLHGPYRRTAELLTRLDPHEPAGDPA